MNLHRLVPNAVASLLLCGWLISLPVGGQSVKLAGSASAGAGAEAEYRAEGERDDVRQREEWFYRQRRYPLSAIPGRARLDALERKEEMRRALAERLNRTAGALGPARGTDGAIPGLASSLASLTAWTPIGPMPTVSSGGAVGLVSGRVTAIAVDPTNASIVFVGGAQGGVWKSTNGGANWSTSFDMEKTLAIGAIAIDPSSCVPGPCTTLYIGTGEQNFSGDSYYGAGVYKSTDGGATWNQTAGTVLNVAGIPSFTGPFNQAVGGVHIGAIVVHPANAMRIFAGVQILENVGGGASSGIFCSDDGGNSWQQVVGGAIGTDVAIHPGGAIGYAALGSNNGDTDPRDTTGQNGVYKTTQANTACSNQVPGQPGAWTLISKAPLPLGTAAGTIRLGLAPSDPAAKTLYAAVATPQTAGSVFNTALAGVFKTMDGGATWSNVYPVGTLPDFCTPQCAYDMPLRVHPNDANTVIVGGARTFNGGQPFFLVRTNDGGNTWTPIAQDSSGTLLHVDQHAIAFGFNGLNVASLFVGNDGGIWSSPLPTSSSPVTWTNLNQTLQLSQFYPGISIDPTSANTAFGGTQDNGTQKYDAAANPPNVWVEQAPCGDGGYTAIDPASPSTIYAACQHIAIRKSLNGGADGFPDSADNGINPSDHVEFIAPLVIDPNPATSSRLYFGTYRVWQTMNGGANWSAISPDLTGGGNTLPTIESLAVSPVNSDVVYAGTFDSKAWRTTNASAGTGATWMEIDAGTLPPRAITQVAADPNDQNTVFATVSGFSGFVINPPTTDTKGHVFRCSATLFSCSDVSGAAAGALPNIPVNAIVVDPLDATSNTLYIGTDVGVFATTDGGATWLPDFPATPPAQNGLPNVAVLSLTLQPTARILRAGTHGRGAWDLQLGTPPLVPALRSISPAGATLGSSNLPVTLTGVNFAAGATVNVTGGTGITVSNVVVASSTTITATFTIAANAAAGTQNVAVTAAGSTSNNIAFGVGTDFLMCIGSPCASTGSGSKPPGMPANTTISLTPSTAGSPFPAGVTLTCTGLPSESACLFSPPSPLPASDGMAATTMVNLSVSTTAPSLVAPRTRGPHPPLAAPRVEVLAWASLLVALSAALVMARKERGARLRWIFSAALILALAGLAGACGGGSGGGSTGPPPDPGTPAGTYPIAVTAASGNASHTVTYTLTVQ